LSAESFASISSTSYLSLLAGCFLSTLYGRLIQSTVIFSQNAFFLLLAAFYVLLLDRLLQKGSAFALLDQLRKDLQTAGIILLSFVAFVFFLLPHPWWPDALGLATSCLNVVLYGAPTSNVLAALKTRNRALLPSMIPTVTTLACVFCWSCYGAFAGNMYIFFPNVLGVALAGLQVYALWSLSS
jgi:uncharacterized protein with PQ loop repeat